MTGTRRCGRIVTRMTMENFTRDPGGATILPQEMRWVHRYLFASDTESEAKTERENLRKLLKPYLLENMEPDERGNFTWNFDRPISTPSGTYRGIMAQRRVSEFTDEEKARELIRAHGLETRCINEIVYEEVDLDELYAANQEGLVSDEEIDSIIYSEESFFLVKVKA